jgi:hypothetical protein
MRNRSLVAPAGLILLSLMLPSVVSASPHRRNVSISTDDNLERVTSCSQIHVRFGDAPAVTTEEQLPVASLRELKVTAPSNGGIYVSGWDRGGYAVTACKASAGSSAALGQINARVDGQSVSASGPDEDDTAWVAFFIVRTPVGGTVDLHSQNGPINISGVSGRVTANVTNGPIGIRDSSGTIDLEAVNGPISIASSSGDVRLRAENGPISVKLSGSSWEGGGLDARTENGPISLRVPERYGSGVVVETSAHAPISCRSVQCRALTRSWADEDNSDRPRHLELGSGAAKVHMTTVNGPVAIKDVD